MKKRWLLRLSVFAGVVVLGFWFVLWWTAPEYRISKRSCDLIQRGMTIDEVTAIICVPAGDYTTRPLSEKDELLRWVLSSRVFDASLHGKDVNAQEWLSDGGAIQILLDQDGKVWSKEFFSIQETLLVKFRRWLRLS